MKYTDTLKLATLELNLDGKMLGRDFLSVYSGTGENNLKKIDAFADSTNRAITQIKNSPKTIYVDAKKSTMGIYTATVPSIEDGVMDLTNNGFYVIRIDSDNETEVVTIRINDTISKQLKKIHTDGTIVDMSVGDIKKGHEYIYRYNGVYLIAINLNALTFMNRPIDDFVLKEDIVDDVLTPSTDVPLSANQGKITNEKIDKIKSDLETDISNLDTELTEKIDTTKTSLQENINSLNEQLTQDIDTAKKEVDDKIVAHIDDKNNPHETTKEQLGLDKIQNIDYAPLDSAALTGSPTSPTPDVNDNSQRIANTEFVTRAIANIEKLTKVFVDSLPEISDAKSDVIYMVKMTDKDGSTYRDEYILDNSSEPYKWELLGTTKVDFTGYATETFVTDKIATETTAREDLDARKADNVSYKDSVFQLTSNNQPIGDPITIESSLGAGVGGFLIDNGDLILCTTGDAMKDTPLYFDESGNLIFNCVTIGG